MARQGSSKRRSAGAAAGSATPLRVGLMVGREWSFPPKFIEEVNRRDEGVGVEFVKIGAELMDEPIPYSVIIDRISHEVPFYRSYLKKAVLQGVTVVNNPFMWSADDKFFDAALATSLGVASPRTIALPNKDYVPGIVHNESLRNLEYPLDWQGITDYIGMPCILKDAHGGGWKEVYVCKTLKELIENYNQSGLLTMIVQEFIQWDHFVRCIALGQEDVLPIKYDPKERKYIVDHAHLTPALGERIVGDSLKLVRALGYDMNSLEWAIRDGVPYAIDFMNPAPDMDVYSLTPVYFQWVVTHMADMAIRLAKEGRKQNKDLRWSAAFTASRREVQATS
ncbi:MAG: RimK family alpha-L-glutamate ligase [Gemmatimonadaceae bacterium]